MPFLTTAVPVNGNYLTAISLLRNTCKYYSSFRGPSPPRDESHNEGINMFQIKLHKDHISNYNLEVDFDRDTLGLTKEDVWIHSSLHKAKEYFNTLVRNVMTSSVPSRLDTLRIQLKDHQGNIVDSECISGRRSLMI